MSAPLDPRRVKGLMQRATEPNAPGCQTTDS